MKFALLAATAYLALLIISVGLVLFVLAGGRGWWFGLALFLAIVYGNGLLLRRLMDWRWERGDRR